jgi:hypothetical protein
MICEISCPANSTYHGWRIDPASLAGDAAYMAPSTQREGQFANVSKSEIPRNRENRRYRFRKKDLRHKTTIRSMSRILPQNRSYQLR